MIKTRFFCSLLLLIVASIVASVAASVALAQKETKIRVLAIPENLRQLGYQDAAPTILLDFGGRVPAGRAIYARVFHGSVDYLVNTVPNQIAGKCVVYADTGRYQVRIDESGHFPIRDLVDFFENHMGEQQQTITLVLEEGDPANVGNALYIERTSVPTYFANAMQLQLGATDDIRNQWQQWRRETAASAPPASQSGGISLLTAIASWFPFGRSSEPGKSAPIAHEMHKLAVPIEPVKDCQKVETVPFDPLLRAAQKTDPAPNTAFPAFAERSSPGCTQ